jgi:hypothetical protein
MIKGDPLRRLLVAVVAIAFASTAALAQSKPFAATMQRVGDDVILDVGSVDISPDGERIVANIPAVTVVIPTNGWFCGYTSEVLDSAGNAVPSSLVVVNVLSLSERELFSPIALRLATVSPGITGVPLPRFLGYRAVAGDTLLVAAQFHRSPDHSWRGVHVRIHFPFVSGKAFIGALRIEPFSFEAMSPGGAHVFDLPPGASERSWEANPAVDGRVLGFSSFVKKYAVHLTFEDRTAQRVLWEQKMDTTADGLPKPVPVQRFLSRLGLSLKHDHLYRLTVVYDNRSGELIPGGGSGAIGGVLLVGGGQRWPAIDRNDAIYVSDIRGFLP